MSNISTKAMLASLHISTWSGKVTDKKVTKEVEDAHGAHNSGRFTKYIVMQEALKPIQKKAGATRQFFYDHTLKWIEGWQLLPAAEYFHFIEEFGKYKQELLDEVEKFLPTYNEWIEEAKARLNGMFNESDYPSPDDLRLKFSIEMKISPVPESNDFRVSLGEEEEEKIRKQIWSDMQDAQAEASRDLWNRVKDALKAMVERLSDKEAVFRDSLVGNVKELIDLLPRLNYTDDAQIIAVCDDMKKLVVPPETLRTNEAMRGEVADRAKQVLQSYGLW